MSISSTLRVAALLLVTAVSRAAAPQSPPISEHRETEPPQSIRLIVELHGTPRVLALDSISSRHDDDLLARLRADLLAPRSAKRAILFEPAIHHEFRSVILGAAVEVHPSAVERIRRLPYVRSVHPDLEVRAPFNPRPVTADLVDARERVNATKLGTGGQGIVVAVIDTGIDYMHPALGGGFGPGFKVGGGWDFVNGDADPMDDNGHGTHVAGTVAASSAQLLGVAPDASLLAYKVLSASGTGFSSDIIAAIERAIDPNEDGDYSDRADVINLSLGGPGDADDPASRAVDNAVAAGVVVVVAAGNDGRIATIGSPGTAVRAITVAASAADDLVAPFSSRGPSPRLLGFKPDVAAPGSAIISSRAGGGLIALDGTSMAAPHVAGVSALLRKLHPEWNPEAIKSAITSSTVPMSEHPFARGTGRVDASAANQVTLISEVSGISFGLLASRNGTSVASRTMRLTNLSGTARMLTFKPGSIPTGVTITVSPTNIQLAAGESGEATIQLVTNNAELAFPNDGLVGGDVIVSGSGSTLRIPWGILRTARATITYDGITTSVLTVGVDGARSESLRGPTTNEIYLPPGGKWDFILTGYDIPQNEGDALDVRRTIVREDVAIDGDHLLQLRTGDATHEVILDGRDDRGIRLDDRSSGNAPPVHIVGIRLVRQADGSVFSSSFLGRRNFVRRVFFSPLSTRYSLYFFEQLFDLEALEGISLEHDVLNGLEQTKTMTRGGSDLLQTTVRWTSPPTRREPIGICSFDANIAGAQIVFTTCFQADPRLGTEIDLHVDRERSSLALAGIQVRLGDVLTQPFRGRDGWIVVSAELIPSPVAPRIGNRGTYFVAAGPAFPFAFPGTTTGFWPHLPQPGFLGSAGEQIFEYHGTSWQVFDQRGTNTASGIWRGPFSSSGVPPLPVPGSRFVATREDLRAAGRFGRGVLEVDFGSNANDLTAPTLTSLRVVDANGGTTGRLAAGESAALLFSVADPDYLRGGETNSSRPESTRVFYRVGARSDWRSLPVLITGSEQGSRNSLRHFPAGDIYRTDLTAVSALRDTWIDLRIEFEDASGNRVRWTHESAFAVGQPTTTRAPAVRR